MARSARSKGLKDPDYLKWLHTLPCRVCILPWLGENTGVAYSNIQSTPTEAAHVGDRGLSQKCSDREAIPLCTDHHTERRDSVHKLGKKFWETHCLDREDLIAEYNKRFEEER